MAAATSVLAVRVVSDARSAQRGLDQTSSRLSKFENAASKAMVPAAAMGAGLIAVGKHAARAASDLQQAQGAVESVFGRSSRAVERYASTSANRLGVARSEYLNSAALMGSALQNAGFSAEKAAHMTDKAFTRSADLAATFGGTAAEAMDAINAAVSRGEFDPLERYAISLNATAVNAELARRGQDKLTGEQLKNAKAAIILDQIYKQSNKVQGQFAREANTAAGAQQRMKAQLEDAAASIGTALLPVVSQLATGLAGVAQWAMRNQQTVMVLAGVLGGLVTTVFAINGALKVFRATQAAVAGVMALWNNSMLILRARLVVITAAQYAASAATAAWTIVQKGLNLAMRMNPLGIVITALVALGAAIAIAWQKSATFRNIVTGAFNAVKGVVLAVINWFKGPFVNFFTQTVPNTFRNGWNAAYQWTANIVGNVLGFIRALPGRIWSFLSSLPSRIGNLFRQAFEWGLNHVRSIGGQIVSWITSIPGRIMNAAASGFRNAGRWLIEGFVNAMRNAGGIISGIAGNVWNAVKGLLNSAISQLNSAFDFTISLGPLGSIHINLPDIPHLADGGIVRQPTVALIGEAGPEAVVPLKRGAGPGQSVDARTFITVNGALDPDAVARQVRGLLDDAQQRRGGITLNRRAGARIGTV